MASAFGHTLLRAAPLVGASALFIATRSTIYADASSSSSSSSSSSEKLPIYPLPDPTIQLVPTQTELERQIGAARKSIQSATSDVRSGVANSVERWIEVEKRVEHEVKSVIPNDEPLTPGLLYVGVATLAGSVFTRFRSFPIRFVTPPLFLLASLNYFQPKLSHNLADYYTALESKHAPTLTQHRQALVASFRDSLQGASQKVHQVGQDAQRGLRSGLSEVESATGLKVGDVLAKAQENKEHVKAQLKDQVRAV
ncbi:hypothetical protein ACQY0O_001331 [Thecaphora frezii]